PRNYVVTLYRDDGWVADSGVPDSREHGDYDRLPLKERNPWNGDDDHVSRRLPSRERDPPVQGRVVGSGGCRPADCIGDGERLGNVAGSRYANEPRRHRGHSGGLHTLYSDLVDWHRVRL